MWVCAPGLCGGGGGRRGWASPPEFFKKQCHCCVRCIKTTTPMWKLWEIAWIVCFCKPHTLIWSILVGRPCLTWLPIPMQGHTYTHTPYVEFKRKSYSPLCNSGLKHIIQIQRHLIIFSDLAPPPPNFMLQAAVLINVCFHSFRWYCIIVR